MTRAVITIRLDVEDVGSGWDSLNALEKAAAGLITGATLIGIEKDVELPEESA